ncbi:unnamed protein product [Calypogeia fissa]
MIKEFPEAELSGRKKVQGFWGAGWRAGGGKRADGRAGVQKEGQGSQTRMSRTLGASGTRDGSPSMDSGDIRGRSGAGDRKADDVDRPRRGRRRRGKTRPTGKIAFWQLGVCVVGESVGAGRARRAASSNAAGHARSFGCLAAHSLDCSLVWFGLVLVVWFVAVVQRVAVWLRSQEEARKARRAGGAKAGRQGKLQQKLLDCYF